MTGLFLEGAKWDADEGCLAEPDPMALFAPMPVIHFKPVEARRERREGIYKAPAYLYPVRTGSRERPSFICEVSLPAGAVGPEHYVRRGTALLLALAS